MPSTTRGVHVNNPVRKTIATVCLSGMLDDKLRASAAAGFDGVEIFENDLVNSHLSPEAIRDRCADLGLSVDMYQPFRDFEALPAEQHETNLRRAERKFDLMERLGTDTMLVCSTLAPQAIDDDDLAAEQLHALATRAAARGIRVAYEALAWGRFVNTWEHSWRIVHQADHPNLGVCLDSFHILSKDPRPTGIATIDPEKLFFLQLADAPRPDMNLLRLSRHHRLFPGQGSFDLIHFVDQVLAAGYTGPLSLEVFNDVFRQSDPGPAAVDAMRSLLSLEDGVATHGSRGPYRVGITEPTSSPELPGWAFAELDVDERSEAEIATTLSALGFVHTGQHRSKPVQLWRHGDCDVVLNRTSEKTTESGTAELAGLAVESRDPGSSAQRARELLAPRLPGQHADTEAELHTIATPDDKRIHFCHTEEDDPSSWRADFTATGTTPAEDPVLDELDHIAVAEPFDHFAESMLFYRSVFDLRPQAETEYAAPFGLVRSQAVGNRFGRIRIAMHAAVLRRGEWAPDVPDPEHVSFGTDDIIGAARSMRDSGAPILRIPENYYDDLDARYELDSELLSELRMLNILYDRDAQGEFFHFCTDLLGSRVFFEIVQRVGDYQGYGAANTPVRMAAHRQARLHRAT
ncbi:bifunctional sugar phosphate isomerase/epimerase/4-hydroxyphenylpyruvate dioxygenase family protein [Actinopolyspora sp. H202]|uniref:bifunctional sugar phosphate isomerase/epimerase/4-hydroxyphenylpyruvate dioxygenase family protein n=1 Tax=Actinopolyspora sp. H202 TaxID=1500456 RepID=UPI003EE7E9C3